MTHSNLVRNSQSIDMELIEGPEWLLYNINDPVYTLLNHLYKDLIRHTYPSISNLIFFWFHHQCQNIYKYLHTHTHTQTHTHTHTHAGETSLAENNSRDLIQYLRWNLISASKTHRFKS